MTSFLQRATLLTLLSASVALTADGNSHHISTTQHPLINGYSAANYANSWDLVEDIFMLQPTAAVTDLSKQTTKTGLFRTGLAAAAIAIAIRFSGMRPFMNTAGPLAAISLGGLSTAACAAWKQSGRQRVEERKAMELIMSQWSDVRSYFPAKLHSAFDAVHELRENESADYSANLDKAIDIAKSELAAEKKSKSRWLAWPSFDWKKRLYTYGGVVAAIISVIAMSNLDRHSGEDYGYLAEEYTSKSMHKSRY